MLNKVRIQLPMPQFTETKTEIPTPEFIDTKVRIEIPTREIKYTEIRTTDAKIRTEIPTTEFTDNEIITEVPEMNETDVTDPPTLEITETDTIPSELIDSQMTKLPATEFTDIKERTEFPTLEFKDEVFTTDVPSSNFDDASVTAAIPIPEFIETEMKTKKPSHEFTDAHEIPPMEFTEDALTTEIPTSEFTDDIFTTQLTHSKPQVPNVPTTTEQTPASTTATPPRPSPVPRIVETRTKPSRSQQRRTTTPFPRIFRPLVVRPTTTTTPEPTTTTPTTTTKSSRRGSSRYNPPPEPSHPNIEKDVALQFKFTAPLSDSVKSGSRSSSLPETDNEVNGRFVSDTPRMKPTRRPATEAPVLTTTQSSKFPHPNYGKSDITYVGGEVVITEVGTMEDTPQYEIQRILGGLGSRRRGLARPQKSPKKQTTTKSPPVVKAKPEEPINDEYYDDYYYDY
ncbi:Zonadhesin [Portunus trituberculatus]|uniref:Zonadhesin n=1 Tax=Portunus trituberculatus TaxID=210409 RepID=A0A5B7DTW7_PORTR|nr:Zonadhesin [Portunus trituberculatus]